MIKWEALNRSKGFGELGFLDVRAMNVCLLVKWIDKLERGDNSLCCSLLINKYLGNKSIFRSEIDVALNLEISARCERVVSKRSWC